MFDTRVADTDAVSYDSCSVSAVLTCVEEKNYRHLSAAEMHHVSFTYHLLYLLMGHLVTRLSCFCSTLRMSCVMFGVRVIISPPTQNQQTCKSTIYLCCMIKYSAQGVSWQIQHSCCICYSTIPHAVFYHTTLITVLSLVLIICMFAMYIASYII